MHTGSQGAYVILWSQTAIDGIAAAPEEDLIEGVTWRWGGRAVRVDGPPNLISLGAATGAQALRARVGRTLHRYFGPGRAPAPFVEADEDGLPPSASFTVSDGRRRYQVSRVPMAEGAPLLLFEDKLPPRDTDLQVIAATAEPRDRKAGQGVICFAKGTEISTPSGPVPIEALEPGDRVLTLDDGPAEILWTGHRRMSGARLYVMPELRPVRVRAGALGTDRPTRDLLVSRAHRLLISGYEARVLYNTPEVLVSAGDLVNDQSVLVDCLVNEITYHHVMLARHQVVWANGVPAESFHPADADLDDIRDEDFLALEEALPEPAGFGAHARRTLKAGEAAILMHGLNTWH